MGLSDRDVADLERSWRKIPPKVLARKYRMTEMELLRFLREQGIATQIQPVELQYIKENIETMPHKAIMRELGLTPTQFEQICRRVLGVKRAKPLADLTLETVIGKVRWLIEERLQMDVDDLLPRQLTNKHFVDRDLYDCIRFAGAVKKNDSQFQHFSAIAFLVCNSYPEVYQPFQFRHAKTNKYFRGPGGKKNLLRAVRWVIEKKMGLKPEHFADFVDNKYFLRTSDLQFYGVGPHWYKEHFGSKQELINELRRIYRSENDRKPSNHQQLKQALRVAGVAVERCYVETCPYKDQYGVHIHHIVPQKDWHAVKFDIHSAPNLMPLCPNHHAEAQRFDWKQLLNQPFEHWRDLLASHLLKSKGVCKEGGYE